MVCPFTLIAARPVGAKMAIRLAVDLRKYWRRVDLPVQARPVIKTGSLVCSISQRAKRALRSQTNSLDAEDSDFTNEWFC